MSRHKRTGVSIRKRTLRTGENHWQVRWREEIDGKVQEFSEQFADLSDAEVFGSKVAGRLKLVRAGKETKIAEDLVKPVGDLDKLIPHFVAARTGTAKEGSVHPATLNYRLKRMAIQYGWKTTENITYDAVVKMVGTFRFEGHQTSADHYLRAVKNFLGWAKSRYHVDDEVFQIEPAKYDAAEKTLWTDAQAYSIMSFLRNPRAHAAQGFGDSGCKVKWTEDDVDRFERFHSLFRLQLLWAPRPVEASRLVVRNWDRKRRVLTIPKKVAKNRCERSFFVDPETATLLDKLTKERSDTDFIFTNTREGRYKPNCQSDFMRQILSFLKIPGSLYCARHFACTRLANDPRLSIKGAMRITGHKTLSEFARYLHVRDRELEIVAESGHSDFLDAKSPPTEEGDPPVALVAI